MHDLFLHACVCVRSYDIAISYANPACIASTGMVGFVTGDVKKSIFDIPESTIVNAK